MWALFVLLLTDINSWKMQKVAHLEMVPHKLHLKLANIADSKQAAISKENCLEAGTIFKNSLHISS